MSQHTSTACSHLGPQSMLFPVNPLTSPGLPVKPLVKPHLHVVRRVKRLVGKRERLVEVPELKVQLLVLPPGLGKRLGVGKLRQVDVDAWSIGIEGGARVQ